jgi:hypothetical protein
MCLWLRLCAEEKKEEKKGPEDPLCPFCKASWKRLCFTTRANQLYSAVEADSEQAGAFDAEIGVAFESVELMNFFRTLRSFYCTICKANAVADGDRSGLSASTRQFRTLKELSIHYEREHSRYLCEACVETRQVFVHERPTYTHAQLLRHFEKGSAGGAEGPIEPHPFCQFCVRTDPRRLLSSASLFCEIMCCAAVLCVDIAFVPVSSIRIGLITAMMSFMCICRRRIGTAPSAIALVRRSTSVTISHSNDIADTTTMSATNRDACR